MPARLGPSKDIPESPAGDASQLDKSGTRDRQSPVTQLSVRRVPSGWADRFRIYQVLIDDQEVARLRPRGSTQLDLPPGTHVLQVTRDWARSTRHRVSGDGAETLSFRCGFFRGVDLRHLTEPEDGSLLFLEPDSG